MLQTHLTSVAFQVRARRSPHTLEKECLSRFKTENKHLKQLNEVKHSFSHYNLVATPYLVELNKNTKYKNTIWVNSKNVESLGVPAPVKKTIDQLTNL